jgi:hypothetical protein
LFQCGLTLLIEWGCLWGPQGMEDQVSPESREAATLTSFRAHLCRVRTPLPPLLPPTPSTTQ